MSDAIIGKAAATVMAVAVVVSLALAGGRNGALAPQAGGKGCPTWMCGSGGNHNETVVRGGSVLAQAPAAEQAVARSAQDAQLQWGPCPAFMPAGCSLAVLQGDPSKPNADVFLKLPGRAAIPDHWHTSAERMVLVAGELHVSYRGQAKQVLKPGMYAYGPAKLPHTAACAGSTPCVLFIAFESAVDAVPTEAAPK